MGLLWNTQVRTRQDWEWRGKMIDPCASFIFQMGDQANPGESANPVVFPLPTTTCENLEFSSS